MTEKYHIEITGVAVGGKSQEQAIAALARYAGITEERAREMFARAPAIVKRDVPEDLAIRYERKLADLGIGARRVPAAVLELETVDAVAVDSSVEVAGETASVSSTASSATAPSSATPVSRQSASGGHSGGHGRGNGGSGSADQAGQKRHVGFVFSGNGYEYFKIWIVNILLTIVTLGIYAPWAKVRNTQYFYGNTSLDNASFAFTADPVKMLIGRLIAVGLLVVFMVVQSFMPLIGLLLAFSLMFVFPWVLNRTFAFYARNSTYRNIRFRFVGRYTDALINYLGWPIIAMLSLGLLTPFMMFKQKQYLIENHRYGNQSFSFRARVGDFYGLVLIAFGVGLVGVIAGALIGVILGLIYQPLGILSGIGAMIGYAIGILYFITNMQNLIFNNTSLSSHDFKARYEIKSFGWLMVSNFLLTVVTLGLYIPWAKVRVAQYAAEHTAVDVAQDLDKFAAISQPDESAFGEEFGDVFDMEVGF
ncbi:YjgN family protein [Microbulbifer pacificus]|uniref:YjgN family protein n=1 Tax=Microbulbifer pacificus TaxID=407164 RepID=UPI000CF4A293|nr:YjgN family protein [Microbulbifer pacificus]